jgi:biotin transport system substrate-specific component
MRKASATSIKNDSFISKRRNDMIQQAAPAAKRKTILKITLVSLFAALTAAGTFISIPLPGSPVPIVLQNLFALISGLVLGPFMGAAAVGLYLLAGAIGAPVFAGASGGFVHLIGPTGGFLFGYILAAFTSGLIAGVPRAGKPAPLWRLGAAVVLGLLMVYVPGVIRLKFAVNASWTGALAAGFIPFVIGDAVKALAAIVIAPRLRRIAAENLEK